PQNRSASLPLQHNRSDDARQTWPEIAHHLDALEGGSAVEGVETDLGDTDVGVARHDPAAEDVGAVPGKIDARNRYFGSEGIVEVGPQRAERIVWNLSRKIAGLLSKAGKQTVEEDGLYSIRNGALP